MSETDWLLYADAVSMVSERLNIDRERADKAIVMAAASDALRTRGRPHHEQAKPIGLKPQTWRGMDPYRALSMLCTPNPGSRVQEDFVNAPTMYKVEFQRYELVGWLSQHPQAPPEIKLGRKRSVRERVKDEMRSFGIMEVKKWSEVAMETQFKANRETVRNARQELIDEDKADR